MKNKVFRTVQSFLVWFEKRTKRNLYIKIHSNGSGEIGDTDTDESLFRFENSAQLARVLDRLVDKYQLEEDNDPET